MQNEHLRQSVRHLLDYDDSRASAPNEHTAAAIAGAGLLFWALVSRSRTRAVLHAAIGGALLLRSAGGAPSKRLGHWMARCPSPNWRRPSGRSWRRPAPSAGRPASARGTAPR